MFALSSESTSAITYLIWDDKSEILAKETFVKITSFNGNLVFKGMNQSLHIVFLFCHFNRLFNFCSSSFIRFITWAATERSYVAFGWHTVMMYAPLAR
jgi:hypothetical protein